MNHLDLEALEHALDAAARAPTRYAYTAAVRSALPPDVAGRVLDALPYRAPETAPRGRSSGVVRVLSPGDPVGARTGRLRAS